MGRNRSDHTDRIIAVPDIVGLTVAEGLHAAADGCWTSFLYRQRIPRGRHHPSQWSQLNGGFSGNSPLQDLAGIAGSKFWSVWTSRAAAGQACANLAAPY